MSQNLSSSRRRFLTHTAMGLLAFAGTPGLLRAMEGMRDMNAMPKAKPRTATANFNPDVEIDLFCKDNSIQILPGEMTRVQQYTAKLVKGPKDTLTEIPGSYLGPIIRLQKGQRVRIRLHNHLAEPTITHWHGLHVPAEVDGHPLYTIDPGVKFVYEFEVLNRAGMNIYHPHPHEATAKQVYHGLAGALIVNDEEEAALGLPSGEFEIPIVIQDKLFSKQNQLRYAQTMHDRMMGFYGDKILVNGKPNFTLDVASRAYRFRVLNGSTARIYKLAWSDGSPMIAIGTDGGLLEAPEKKPYIMLAPGERLDLWADFSGKTVGTELVLKSAEFSGVLPKMAERMMRGGGMGEKGGGMGGMGGGMGMMHANALPVGSDYTILKVRVTEKATSSPKLPEQLSKITRYQLMDTVNPNNPRPIGISEAPMAMLLNGRPYAYNDAQAIEKIPVNTIQLMEIFHAHGGSGGHGGAKKTEAGHPAGKSSADMKAMPSMKEGEKMTGDMQHGGGSNEKSTEKSGEMKHEGGMGGMGMMHGGQSGGGMGGMMGGMGGMGMQHGGDGAGEKSGGMKHGGGMGGMMDGMGGMGMQHGGDGAGEKSGGMKHGGGMGGMMGGMGGMDMMQGGGMGGMGGGMSLSMAHPIHLHGQFFQIVARNTDDVEEDYASVKDGFITSGFKDTVLVMPGEKVRIIKPFQDFKGYFMYHCHNLEHEDMGMMRDFLVE